VFVPSWVRLAVLMICATPALAAQFDGGPKPKAGRAVASWQVERQGPVAIGIRVIRARNDTTVPIRVTQVRLSHCTNARTTCDLHPLGLTIVAPGQVVDLLDVQPIALGSKPRFSFDVDWHTATGADSPPVTECTDAPLPLPDDTAAVRRAQPVPTAINIPPIAWSKPARARVTFHVAASGRVDSADVDGITDGSALAKLRKVLATYTFRAGSYRGCPVPGTATMTITFGHQ
jgi:hypothetical protein